MTLRGRSLPSPLRLALLLALGACTEKLTAPGVCPDFCPGGSIQVEDTVLTDVIVRDSAFRGYLEAYQGEVLPVADIPGVVDVRAIFRMIAMFTRVQPNPADTTTVPITVDSARLRLILEHRDTNATNLRLKIYRLPVDIDTLTTFAQLDPWFTDSLVDSINVSALYALPGSYDSLTTDTVRTDPSTGQELRINATSGITMLVLPFDTSQARFLEADSGRVAYGVRVAADTLASVALGANDIVFNRDASILWFYSYPFDADSTVHTSQSRETFFDSFVMDPPTPALDSNLAVGGVPAARSLLRVTMPSFLRDTADVVRATLVLVPAAAVQGAAGDSFTVVTRPVVADLGPKSPLLTNSALFGSTIIRIGSTDTVRIEVTNMIRTWAFDTSAVTTFVLGQVPEAANYTEIRFYSTRAPAFRPALHVTYVRRFPFGAP